MVGLRDDISPNNSNKLLGAITIIISGLLLPVVICRLSIVGRHSDTLLVLVISFSQLPIQF